MIRIEYPSWPYRIKKEEGKELIFDELRRQWIRLTPEEWVRQNFLQYLVQTMRYPASLIAVERELKLGELKKRFDILVYNRQHQPWLMVECKAMEVQLDQSVLEQVLRYNIAVPVPYLVITNGHYCAGFEKQEQQLQQMEMLPSFIN
ncbi:type I restriction enzyme HsdR N-terminal domain-containing protein [Paraflavitalea sp. CAU 1676]|uniref:type I restriction enzyme HsdR N-terminal domain-containing protein n=1 Tax=Paraflavitalea sp. CAU 1676 TaxID=3032598 RepID=UPI0023DAAB8A|nr:type I restriction enzyme HsdR N-terminal domain-containing protein [Paraflavitalea sp. CAU 1676]MDF2189731.1 type I restriction enzyme HsdR N-terminal domain-containing protein [Paraflavitalea sp. CAU 1676]